MFKRIETQPVTLYVPRQLPPVPADIESPAKYILDRIHTGRALRKADDQGFVPLHSATLKQITRDYAKGKGWLLDGGLVETNGRYVPGETSMGWRWGSGYNHPTPTPAPERLAGKITQQRVTKVKRYGRVPRYLLSWLLAVDFDLEAARQAEELFGVGEGNEPVDLTTGRLIADGAFEFSVCEYGRCHSLITRLPKRLRPYLSIEGQPLVGVDLANSQPLLLCRTLNQSETKPFGSYDAQVGAAGCVTPKSVSSCSDSLRVKPIGCDDLSRYQTICEEGQIYEHLLQAIGLEVTALNRDDFKEEFFRDIMFGTAKRVRRASRAFASEFPAVWAAVQQAKWPDHRPFSWAMQRLESEIMIGGVCGRLMQGHPDVPVVTIHDMILTTPPHVELVTSTIRQVLDGYGLHPTLRVER